MLKPSPVASVKTSMDPAEPRGDTALKSETDILSFISRLNQHAFFFVSQKDSQNDKVNHTTISEAASKPTKTS